MLSFIPVYNDATAVAYLSLYLGVGGQRGWGGGQTLVGGGGQEDGIAMILSPITFIVHNQKLNGGRGSGRGG